MSRTCRKSSLTDRPKDPRAAFGGSDPTSLMGMFARVDGFVWGESANSAVPKLHLVAVMLGYCQSVVERKPDKTKEQMRALADLVAHVTSLADPQAASPALASPCTDHRLAEASDPGDAADADSRS